MGRGQTRKYHFSIGQQIGMLTVQYACPGGWMCKCECGTVKIIIGSELVFGKAVSCGCFHRKMVSDKFKVHGRSRDRVYVIWRNMKSRCLNSNSGQYKDYGGRGITICERWLNSFENFLADMGDPPDGYTIEREDVNGNYEPDNCTWATMLEQANNKRGSLTVTYNKETHTISDWCRLLSLKYDTVNDRYNCGLIPETGLFAGGDFSKAMANEG